VREALIVVWEASDRICGKRLQSLMPILVEAMERHRHLQFVPRKNLGRVLRPRCRIENPAHLLLRVSGVFGVHGTNFVKTMLRLGRKRRELRIVADQIGGPTEARDIADAILTMAAACRPPRFSAWGTYHFAGAPSTSWYEFADAIFARARPPVPHLVLTLPPGCPHS
jgi:hypothetical protein